MAALLRSVTDYRVNRVEISSTEIMSSNISDPLPNRSDNPSEKVRKTSGDFDDTKKALVFFTETVAKEGNTDMVEKK